MKDNIMKNKETKKGKLTIIVSDESNLLYFKDDSTIKSFCVSSESLTTNENNIKALKSYLKSEDITLYTDKNDTKNFRKWFGKFEVKIPGYETNTSSLRHTVAIRKEKPKNGWYKHENNEYPKWLVYFDFENNKSFGFNSIGGWGVNFSEVYFFKYKFTTATHEEVEQRLKEEAVKLGFKKGVKTKFGKIHEEDFSLKDNNLWMEDQIIMQNGVWAEIVEETKPNFKPVYMKCTQEQFDRMRPKLESVGCEISLITSFNKCDYLVNNHNGFEKRVTNLNSIQMCNIKYNRTEVHTEAEFLEACGYVEDTLVMGNGSTISNVKESDSKSIEELHAEHRSKCFSEQINQDYKEVCKEYGVDPNKPIKGCIYKPLINRRCSEHSVGMAYDKEKLKLQGQKESNGKTRYELDFEFIEAMAKRIEGESKYPPYNWQKPTNTEELTNAILRHAIELKKGNFDDNGELGHLLAVACNAMFVYYQLKNNK